MTKVVLDTNVYISAIIFGGNPRQIINQAQNKTIQIFISTSILLEIAQKLKNKFSWNTNQVKHAIKTISKTTTIVHPTINVNIVKSDPSDNKIIDCALEAKAKYIVSGDKHLLSLKKHRNIKIISPHQFLNLSPNLKN